MSLNVPTMAELAARGETAEVLFWVGCAGSFDERAKKVTKAVAKLLNQAGVSFAVLGAEESCTGDPARRAGNEFLFQMQALQNIEILNGYSVQKIVAACPHCFNTLKNEYPQLGGTYEVFHHSQFIEQLLRDGRLRVEGGSFKGKRIVFHDPCYLGRANGEYEAPRTLLAQLDAEIHEMKRSKKNGLCCGAGGAQIFKEPEAGTAEVHHVRAEEAIATGADIIAVGCPFCKLMLTDGVTHHAKEGQVQVLDIAEAIATANDL
jgi:Fe-S oxidoreductase